LNWAARLPCSVRKCGFDLSAGKAIFPDDVKRFHETPRLTANVTLGSCEFKGLNMGGR
jgi:hypothetical protein